MNEGINVCCKFLHIVECGDSEEHNHIICEPWQELGDSVTINNEWVGNYCLSEEFKACLYYPRGEG